MTGRGSEDIHKALTAIAADWKSIYPDVSFDYSFFDETIAAFL